MTAYIFENNNFMNNYNPFPLKGLLAHPRYFSYAKANKNIFCHKLRKKADVDAKCVASMIRW